MTREISDPLAFGHIPNLHEAIVGPDSEVRALLQPTDRRDGVVRPDIAELCYVAGPSTPEVHVAPQPDAEDVL